MRKEKFTFKDIVSIIIAIIIDIIFFSIVIGSFVVLFFKNPSIFTFVGAFFATIVPGLFSYGLTSALVEFIRGK